MDIFESLENLNVSEECFNDIMSRIEEDLYDLVGRAEKKGIVSPNKAETLKNKARWFRDQERLIKNLIKVSFFLNFTLY